MKVILIAGSLLILPTISSYHIIKDKLYNKSNTLERMIDNTRQGTKNYGLDWGAKTDELIENRLNTGDIIFFYRKRSKFSIFKNTYNIYNSMAMVLKFPSQTFLVEINNGKYNFIKYDELLKDGGVDSVMIRFLNNDNRSILNLEESHQDSQDSVKLGENIFLKLKKEGNFYNTIDLWQEFLLDSKICNYDKKVKINEYDINSLSKKTYPLCIKPKNGFDYSQELIVRTRNNYL